jgi:hypothetical protein
MAEVSPGKRRAHLLRLPIMPIFAYEKHQL